MSSERANKTAPNPTRLQVTVGESISGSIGVRAGGFPVKPLNSTHQLIVQRGSDCGGPDRQKQSKVDVHIKVDDSIHKLMSCECTLTGGNSTKPPQLGYNKKLTVTHNSRELRQVIVILNFWILIISLKINYYVQLNSRR